MICETGRSSAADQGAGEPVSCGYASRDLQPNGDGGQITVFGKGSVTRSIQLPRPSGSFCLPSRRTTYP